MQVVETIKMASHIVGHDINYYYQSCHNHDYYEIIMIVSGKAIHHVNDSIQMLSSGNLIFVRPDDAHYFMPYSDASERYEFFNIKVFREDIEHEYTQYSNMKQKIESCELPPLIMLSSTQVSFLQQKLRRLKEIEFEEEREYLYYSILKDVCFLMLDSPDIITDKTPTWMKELLLSVEKQNLAELSYAKILKMSGVSKSYLSKSFKKYLNMSPTEYINNLRLECAYELISTTDYSLLDICMMTGFNSYSYFFRLFSKKYKSSPNSIR